MHDLKGTSPLHIACKVRKLPGNTKRDGINPLGYPSKGHLFRFLFANPVQLSKRHTRYAGRQAMHVFIFHLTQIAMDKQVFIYEFKVNRRIHKRWHFGFYHRYHFPKYGLWDVNLVFN